MNRFKEWIGGDYTPLEHAAIAVTVQLAMWLLLGNLLAGTAAGIAVFIGREQAQAEKRWKAAWGSFHWWRGLDVRRWDRASVMDLVAPTVACSTVFLLVCVSGW